MGAVLNRANHPLNNPREDLLEECEYEHETLNSRTPIILIKLYNVEFPALVDSGSEICALSEQVWSQISEFHHLIPTFSCSGIKVTGAFKNKQRRIKKQSLITFSIESINVSHEFLLIPDLAYPLILGADLLRLLHAKIDLGTENILFKIEQTWLEVPEIKVTHEYLYSEPLDLKPINGKKVALISGTECQYSPISAEFEEVVQNSVIDTEQKNYFKLLLEKHKNLFSDKPGYVSSYVHHIRLRDNSEFCLKQYPVPINHKEAIQKQLDLMEEWGVICRMATPYVSPIMTALKKDNSVRICLDARHLNKVMEREYETPRPVEEILHSLKKIGYMSTLDCTHGYWAIPLSKDSQKFTGFKFDGKTYCFRTLPFGLSSSVSAFTRCITSILGSDFKSFVTIYVDDILIISETFDQHMKHLSLVFTRLKEAGFTLRLSKCAFFRTEMPFLGYILDKKGYHPDPDRTQAIVDYRVPKNVKELQRFLGLANFDRSFCADFSSIAAPLNLLLRKKVRWRWTDVEQRAFENLKNKLKESTLLYHPREEIPYCLQTDASDTGIGAQLFQMVEGKRCVVAWASRLLLDREKRYHICERETLALVWSLQKFRIYLLGRPFTVYTDNSAVAYLGSCRLLSARIARYALAIQEFDFTLKYIPGTQNVIADALSRYSAVRPPAPSNRLFKILPVLRFPSEIQTILKNIRKYQQQDDKLLDIINNLPNQNESRFLLHKNILYLRRSNDDFYLLCIPKSLAPKIVDAYHCLLGHFGSYKTWNALKNEVWWNNMAKDVKKVIRTCDICQKAKMTALPNPPHKAIIPQTKNVLVALDLYGPLPKSRGGVTFICVLLDVFTKYVTCYPLKKATTHAILHRLTSDYFPKKGIPENILTDHGTQFTAAKWKASLNTLGIKVIFSSVRHPQANPSERVMRELGRLFRTYCNDQHTRWAYELSKFQLFINSLVHESTGFSPQELQLGTERVKILPQSLRGPPTDRPPIPLERKLILARETLESKAARRAIRQPARPYYNFQPGDLVLLKSNPVSSAIKSETKKFLLLFEGPYIIKKSISFATYILIEPTTNQERGSFHASHLKKYHQPIEP